MVGTRPVCAPALRVDAVCRAAAARTTEDLATASRLFPTSCFTLATDSTGAGLTETLVTR